MDTKTNLNTKSVVAEKTDNQFQDINSIQIPTPEELGFDSSDFSPKPLPQVEKPKEEKKGFFSKFSKKSEPKTESMTIPEIPKMDNFSFPEFDKNPIQPVQNIQAEKSAETEYLNDKLKEPINMPIIEEPKPKKEKKIAAQELIDSHVADDETFNSITDKLNEIEEALKKHLEEIEQKMSAVRNIEKEIKMLDVKIVKNSPKKPSKIASKKQVKKAVKKGKKK